MLESSKDDLGLTHTFITIEANKLVWEAKKKYYNGSHNPYVVSDMIKIAYDELGKRNVSL